MRSFSRATVTRAVVCYGARSITGIRRQQPSSSSSSYSPVHRPTRQERNSIPWNLSSTTTTRSLPSSPVRKFSAEPVVFDDPLPASEIDPAAEEDEKKIKELAEDGKWEEAMKLLHSIREKDIKPSMAASTDVVAVCRRALKYSEADECYQTMVEEHIPEDVFKAYAAEMPEDETKRVSARSLAIAVMMQEDPDNIVQKDEETYRGLLLNLQDDGAWQAALLLAEQADREGIVLENFSVNAICCVLTTAGYADVSAMVYEKLILERLDQLTDESRAVSEEPWKVDRFSKMGLDLHSLTASAASAVVRIALLDIMRKPEKRPYYTPDRTIRIVTGLGNNSEGGEAVIKPQIIALLDSLKIEHAFQRNNEGCLEIEPAAIKAYIERIASKDGAKLMA